MSVQKHNAKSLYTITEMLVHLEKRRKINISYQRRLLSSAIFIYQLSNGQSITPISYKRASPGKAEMCVIMKLFCLLYNLVSYCSPSFISLHSLHGLFWQYIVLCKEGGRTAQKRVIYSNEAQRVYLTELKAI